MQRTAKVPKGIEGKRLTISGLLTARTRHLRFTRRQWCDILRCIILSEP